MASKRNSRAYVDEGKHRSEGQPTNPTAHSSRRESRSSVKDDHFQVIADLELVEQNGTIPRDSVRSLPLSSVGKDPSARSMANPRSLDKTVSSSIRPPVTIRPVETTTASGDARPVNFGLVVPGVFRSGYPQPADYNYLQSLRLKTIVSLVKRDTLDHELASFISSNGIRHLLFNMKGTKKEAIPEATMASILQVVLDQQQYPLLIHCNHGKHRTGCVVAVIRKLSGWDLRTMLDEYKSFAAPKVRECDVDYISSIQPAAFGPSALRSSALRFSPGQLRNFSRFLIISAFVLVLWLVSGSQMTIVRDNWSS